ncbi:hypothetical protein SDC9_119553 [bioreactor metagenome]|uniref:Uncharacterized protein n=1 Tax=bioreactor metagenome TaxID=1076179 RepID=A0A645C5X2_9ZZZZ
MHAVVHHALVILGFPGWAQVIELFIQFCLLGIPLSLQPGYDFLGYGLVRFDRCIRQVRRNRIAFRKAIHDFLHRVIDDEAVIFIA